jgi:predicted nucleic acid-binding protein
MAGFQLSINGRFWVSTKAETWMEAIRLADRARAAGTTTPLANLLIFACAKLNGVEVEHDDDHFDALSKLEA